MKFRRQIENINPPRSGGLPVCVIQKYCARRTPTLTLSEAEGSAASGCTPGTWISDAGSGGTRTTNLSRLPGFVFVAALALLTAGCVDMGENPPPVDAHQHGGSEAMSIYVSDSTTLEGAGLTFRISRTGSTSDSVSVTFMTSNGMAFNGEDFFGDTGIVHFDSGVSSTNIVVGTLADNLLEDGESFTLTISNPSHDSATIVDQVALGQIWDDDGVSYSTEIRPLILRDCAISGCHGGGSVQGGVNLGTGQWSEIRSASHIGELIIVPKDAFGSHMYEAVETGFMPSGLSPWTPQEVQLLQDWINQDAQDN